MRDASYRHPLVVGIDLATANARIEVVRVSSGAVVFSASIGYPSGIVGEGVREQAPAYAECVRGLIASATAQLGAQAEGILSISVTGTSGTLVPTDRWGVPVGNSVLYNDQRGAEYLTRLKTDDGARRSVGNRPTTALTRLAWMHGKMGAERYLTTPDVVIADLAREVLPTDTSHALKLGIETSAGAWPEAALDVLDIPISVLPDLVQPGTVIGEVDNTVARELGLPPGVRIVAGMTDGCTAQLATGAVNVGDTVGTLGTTLVVKGASGFEIDALHLGVYSHRAPGGVFLVGGASNVGAHALGMIPDRRDIEELDRQALDLEAPSGVCYPLVDVGERFPFADPRAKRFWLRTGVRVRDKRVDDHRTLLEGIAFVERRGLEVLSALGQPRRRHFVSGGASSSSEWNVLRASVLNRALAVPEHRSSAFGAALLAASPFSSLATAVTVMAGSRSWVEPRASLVDGLNQRYGLFLEELKARGNA